MKKLLITIFLLSISTINVYSQEKSVKGRVISEHYETMPGVLIFSSANVIVGKTDLNGYFQIEIPIAVKEIFFSSVGLEPTTIEFANYCDTVEVVILLSGSYDFMSLNKVNRLRLKRFKKLPKLHKEAFKKGIFETEKACYKQKFS